MNVHYFNTYLQGGAAYGAINLYKTLKTDAPSIQADFFYMKDLTDGSKVNSLKKQGNFIEKHQLQFNKTSISTLINSLKARKHYSYIESHLDGRCNIYEQFSYSKQYIKTPYKWYSKKLPDIIHLHWIAEWIDYPSFFKSIPDELPIVWTLHDQNPMTGGCHYCWECEKYKTGCNQCPQLGSEGKGDLAKKNWLVKLEALKNKNLHIVGDSTWISQQAKKSPLFAAAKSFHTIHYSIDFNTFQPSDNRNNILRKYNIPEDAFILCFGAADFTNRRKGFPELMEALKQVKTASKNIQCLVFGAGKIDEDLSHLPPIHFTGKLTPSELAEVYSASDLFIIPSLYEAFGLTAIESMACGTPVIGFNTGGIPDSVKEGMSGWLVEKGNNKQLAKKILYLVQNRDEVKKIGQLAIPFVRDNFNSKMETAKYILLYKNILKKL